MLEQVARRSCGCVIPGSVQGHIGCGFEPPSLVEGVPAHGGGVVTRSSLRFLPAHTSYDSYEAMPILDEPFASIKWNTLELI